MLKNFRDIGWNPKIIKELSDRNLEGCELQKNSLPKEKILTDFCVKIRNEWPNLQFFLITGDEVWQARSKIFLYKKFWKKFHSQVQPINTSEWEVVGNEKSKYFGAAPLKSNEWLLQSEIFELQTTWLIGIKSDFEIEDFSSEFPNGWEERIPKTITDFASKNDSILSKPFRPENNEPNGILIISTNESNSTMQRSIFKFRDDS